MLHLQFFHTPFLLPPLHDAYYPLLQCLLSPDSLSGSTSPGKWLLPSMTLIILRLTLLIHSTILVNLYCILQCLLSPHSLSASTAQPKYLPPPLSLIIPY